MAEKITSKKAKTQVKNAVKPKKLSKWAKFMKKHPEGIIEIHDLKAILK